MCTNDFYLWQSHTSKFSVVLYASDAAVAATTTTANSPYVYIIQSFGGIFCTFIFAHSISGVDIVSLTLHKMLYFACALTQWICMWLSKHLPTDDDLDIESHYQCRCHLCVAEWLIDIVKCIRLISSIVLF